MYVSGGQFYVFVACVALGGACGILFSISQLIKIKISNIILRIIPDLIAFLITALIYAIYSHALSFPNFRIYMILGVIVGITLYFKSFHIMLAKYVKKLYNLLSKLIKNLINKEKNQRWTNRRLKG